MAGISCLLIDKAAYETQDFVLKAIRRDVINRVDISPSPFIPTAIDDSGYQTDDTTVFMVRRPHDMFIMEFILMTENKNS